MPPRRALASGNRGEKASGSSSSSSSFPKPSALVSGLVVSYNENENSSSSSTTTHVVDITTCGFRGAELTEPTQGVWMALWDSRENCCLVQCAVPKTFAFDRGTTERVHVSCPSLNEDVVRVWIAPARGTWQPETVRIGSNTFRYAGAEPLGERQANGAAELKAFDAEEDERRRAESAIADREAFEATRRAALAANAALVAAGSAAAAAALGPVDAAHFAAGGGVGLAYLSLLSKSVSSIGLGDPEEPGGEAERGDDEGKGIAWPSASASAKAISEFPGTRLAMVAALAYAIVSHRIAAAPEGGDQVVLTAIAETVGGVLMYKLAVLSTAAVGRPADE